MSPRRSLGERIRRSLCKCLFLFSFPLSPPASRRQFCVNVALVCAVQPLNNYKNTLVYLVPRGIRSWYGASLAIFWSVHQSSCTVGHPQRICSHLLLPSQSPRTLPARLVVADLFGHSV
ncbi:hypothetical protein LY78DRAFT_219089 [Colletotrichum sublineola]|nr:hypothetical protein LY78DRAFT_219089 [Colletotrichum sublineola]